MNLENLPYGKPLRTNDLLPNNSLVIRENPFAQSIVVCGYNGMWPDAL
jgi:hypothetical protein